MSTFEWNSISLAPEFLPEPMHEANRMIVWMQTGQENGYRHWERISTVPGEEAVVRKGVVAVAAHVLPTREKLVGVFGKLMQSIRKPSGEKIWHLPTGGYAEQTGDRQTDWVLVWSQEEALDESTVATFWPGEHEVRQLGDNVFLVSGVSPRESAPEGKPVEQALALLHQAREKQDRPAEVSALTDLGVAYLRAGDGQNAVRHLEDALAMSSELGDPQRSMDITGNLGEALLQIGQHWRAQELIENQLQQARENKDHLSEKMALTNLGKYYTQVPDQERALQVYQQAMQLAEEAGDREHQASLAWAMAILYAQVRQNDQAYQLGQRAVTIYEESGNPQAGKLAQELQQFRQNAGMLSQDEKTQSPNWWNMASSAAGAMGKFLGSGMKTVPARVRQQRLRTCGLCEHHTGLRCKLCGCFTNVKSWLPHGQCPIGKWTNEE